MSRRDSRVHIAVRQNDALLEFENFKKKFLLANKHITKLNSTLSVRIEELNAQISTLYVENLRLRASEIALATQLKREKEKSQRIMGDAEAATLNLLKHLGGIRQSFNVPQQTTQSHPSQPPRAKRPTPKSSPVARLAQVPSVPGISEDPEPDCASNSNDESDRLALFPGRTSGTPATAKPRLSVSRLPLPLRVASPPLVDAPLIDLLAEETVGKKRKPTRRQSGLLSILQAPPRPSSPAFGSPIRLEAGLAEEQEETAAINGDAVPALREEEEELEEVVKKVKKKARLRAPEPDQAAPAERTERKKGKEKIEVKSKLQDVTNSPRSRASEVPRRDEIPDPDSSALTALPSSPLSSPSSTPEASYLPTPQPSSAGSTPARTHFHLPAALIGSSSSDAEAIAAAGRERRARKSVNYAEPKLNTKMRKPDGVPPLSTRFSLTPAVTPDPTPAPTPSHRRSSLEDPSTATELLPPRPQSQPSGESPSRVSSRASAARKKPRRSPVLDEDAIDDDGAEADAEFSDFRSNSAAWLNIDGRRRSALQGGAASAHRRGEGDDGRRHSLAI